MPAVVRVLGLAASLALPAPAQATEAKEPAPTPPSVTVLGEVDEHRVPVSEQSTVLSVFVAAKARGTAAMNALVVVRCDGTVTLRMRVDLSHMVRTGMTAQNFRLRDGDLLFVPSKDMMAAAKTDIDLVDAVVRATPAEHWSAAQRARFAAWRLLSERDPARRHDQVVEFGKLAAEGATAVAPLTAALDGDVAIARDAATALGMLGVAAAPALPELTKRTEGGDVQLQERCRAAIRAIRASINLKREVPAK